MDPQQMIPDGRAMIIKELNIGHLSKEEQDTIVDSLAEVLLRRVLLKLFQLIPENERDNFQSLLTRQDGAAAQALVQKYVPDSPEMIRVELRAGIDEHKRLVAEQIRKNSKK